MNWFNDLFIVFISLLMAILAKKKLSFSNGNERTLGVSLLILSFISLVYGLVKVTQNIESTFLLILSMALGIVCWAILLSISAVIYKTLKDKILVLTISLLFIFWIISSDYEYSWGDSVLFLGLVFLIYSQFPRRYLGIK